MRQNAITYSWQRVRPTPPPPPLPYMAECVVERERKRERDTYRVAFIIASGKNGVLNV